MPLFVIHPENCVPIHGLVLPNSLGSRVPYSMRNPDNPRIYSIIIATMNGPHRCSIIFSVITETSCKELKICKAIAVILAENFV
jgi:hypothetical protein